MKPKDSSALAKATVGAALVVAVAAGCGGPTTVETGFEQSPSITLPELAPARGVILISLDTLRADRLGAYGYGGGTSPFLDQIAAERGILFERVVAQYPGTLISHMSMLTGLYPREHGVFPPASTLSGEIPLLAEVLQKKGFRTSGHTEGGFMDGDFGFARGFDEFTDTPYQDDRDIERTFSRGLEFLAGLEAEDNFFLFLHTYSIHDPYLPPAGFGEVGDKQIEPPPTAKSLKEANRGFTATSPTVVAAYSRLYDASVRYVDGQLERFFGELEELGLIDEVVVIVTSDHGEAFGEHGRLGHEQTYPEELLVPLIVIHPDLDTGLRVLGLAELVDVAPTIFELVTGTSMDNVSGRSLMSTTSPRLAYSETADPARQRVHLSAENGDFWMLIETEYLSDPDGAWLPLDNAIDVQRPADLELLAFDGPKQVSVVVEDEFIDELEIRGHWKDVPIVGSGRARVRLLTDKCQSPQRLGSGDDPRCLALKLGKIPPRRVELFELERDPAAANDLSRVEDVRTRRMVRELRERNFTSRASGEAISLDDETVATLKALGYL